MSKEQARLPWESIGPEHALNAKRAGMVVDIARCVGCHSCSIACKTEHQVPLGNFRQRTHYLQRPDQTQMTFVPMLCMHCQDAPCIEACPTGALGKLDDGRVVIDESRCNGTKACIPACPYGAISINRTTDRAEKCDFCVQRTSVGLQPACVEACPTEALRFGDMDTPGDPVAAYAADKKAVPYKESAGTRPSVLYVGHKTWMEASATSVQRTSDEDGIIYE